VPCARAQAQWHSFKLQHPQPVEYKGVRLDCGYRMGLLVEDKLIIELKSVEQIKEILSQGGHFPTGLPIPSMDTG